MSASSSSPTVGGFRAGDKLGDAVRSMLAHLVAVRSSQAERAVVAHLHAMDDATLRKAGYSRDQIRKIRGGYSPYTA